MMATRPSEQCWSSTAQHRPNRQSEWCLNGVVRIIKKEDGICINVFVCVCQAQTTDSFLIRMDSYWIPMGILWFSYGSYQFHMGPPLLVCPVLHCHCCPVLVSCYRMPIGSYGIPRGFMMAMMVINIILILIWFMMEIDVDIPPYI